MTLKSGTILGSFEIREPLGAGGMGEVYRARDRRLNRDVAVKLLPEAFAQNAQRLARFEREARILGSLNHPNIAVIHGLESSGKVRFLVMELVEGETLAARMGRGAMERQECLPIFRQIAEALEAAHERGVIHRDLKPANVKITPQGRVKVLDFGLAKSVDDEPKAHDLSHSPTLTRDLTRAGMIVGTAAYMSPEQARGKVVDRRADVWSFGCMLYEALSGQKPFEGDTVTDIVADVIKKEPSWEQLPPGVPVKLLELIERCLRKDPQMRLRDVGDARLAIDEILSGQSAPAVAARDTPSTPARLSLAWMAAALVAGVIGGVAGWSLKPPASPPSLARLSLTVPPNQHLSNLGRNAVALSGDGRQIVYSANDQLYLRALDRREASSIPGTEGGRSPFFSPDSAWIGFWANGELRKAPLAGGAPTTLCAAQNLWGASWSPDERIVYGQGAAGIFEVPAEGGEPKALVRLDPKKREFAAHGPQMLPGGQVVLFTLRTGGEWDDAQIVAQHLGTGERRVLVEGGTEARYAPSGHLVFARRGTILAVPLDTERLEIRGRPVTALEGVSQSSDEKTGAAHFSFSESGTLVYAPRGTLAKRMLVWVTRNGVEEALALPPAPYEHGRISADGRRVVVDSRDGGDVWVYNVERNTLARLTVDGRDLHPIWTPDGRRVTFDGTKPTPGLYWKEADGSGPAELLLESPLPVTPTSWSPDGSTLAFEQDDPETAGSDIWLLPLEGGRTPIAFLTTRFIESGATFSPDGRWIAYVSNETGQDDVYVQAYPGPGGKYLISAGGGRQPVWSRDGRELFYRRGDQMWTVGIQTEPVFRASKPEPLFAGRYYDEPLEGHPLFDVSPDGERFLMVKTITEAEAPRELHLVLNWFQELKALVPPIGR